MGVISRGGWKGAFSRLGSGVFEALEFFCCVYNHFCILVGFCEYQEVAFYSLQMANVVVCV